MTLLIFVLMILTFVFIVGACIGSFLNVVILRAFSNESICFPGSKCPKCQKPLKWYHNIPVLSYLFLKGKCAFCNDKISIQYPIIELVTGFLFVLIFLKFGINLNALFMLFFASLFVVLATTDIKEKVVFDMHTYFLIALGLIYNLFNIGHLYAGANIIHLWKLSITINNSFLASIFGIILGILVMEIFARFGYLVAGARAFGEGDTYIAAGLGSIFGVQYLLTVLLYSFIIQIFFTIPVFIKKLISNKDVKTIVSLLLFFLLAIIMKYLDYNIQYQNFYIFITLAILLCSVGVYLCVRILSGLKNNPQNMTYLPFGPAMVVASLILIFIN